MLVHRRLGAAHQQEIGVGRDGFGEGGAGCCRCRRARTGGIRIGHGFLGHVLVGRVCIGPVRRERVRVGQRCRMGCGCGSCSGVAVAADDIAASLEQPGLARGFRARRAGDMAVGIAHHHDPVVGRAEPALDRLALLEQPCDVLVFLEPARGHQLAQLHAGVDLVARRVFLVQPVVGELATQQRLERLLDEGVDFGTVLPGQDFGQRAHDHQIVEGVVGQPDGNDVQDLADMFFGQRAQHFLLFVRGDALAHLCCAHDIGERCGAVAGHLVGPGVLVLLLVDDVELPPVEQQFQRPAQEPRVAGLLEGDQVAFGHAEHVQLRAPVAIVERIRAPGDGQRQRVGLDIRARREHVVVGRRRRLRARREAELPDHDRQWPGRSILCSRGRSAIGRQHRSFPASSGKGFSRTARLIWRAGWAVNSRKDRTATIGDATAQARGGVRR